LRLHAWAPIQYRAAALSATLIQEHRRQDSKPDGAVEAAFAQVLHAEQAARAAIADARAQALQVAEHSRAQARARAERTRRHLAAVRAAFERRLQAELAAIAAAAETLRNPAPLQAADAARVERAVRELAAQMTGAAPSTEPNTHLDGGPP